MPTLSKSLAFPITASLTGLLGVIVARTVQDIFLWPADDHDSLFALALLLIVSFYCLGFAITSSPWRQRSQVPRRRRIAMVSVVLGFGITVAAAYQIPDLARPDFEARHRPLVERLHGNARPCATFIAEQAAHPLPSVAAMRAPGFYMENASGNPHFILAYMMHPDNLGGSTIYYNSRDRQWHYHNHADCDCCTQTCPSIALREMVAKMEECRAEVEG